MHFNLHIRKINRLSAANIQHRLTTNVIGRQIFCYSKIDSTNNKAKQEHAQPHGTVFIAESQTNGRGRRGNSWVSSSGDGIWMSILLKPDILPDQAAQITLVAGLAVCRSINKLFFDTLEATIKWPNDIIVNGKKVCGILTELTAGTVVVGIGINVNTKNFPKVLWQKATSLFIETGKKQDRILLIQTILTEFEHLYTVFCADGFSGIADAYKKHCITLRKDVLILSPQESYTARAVDIDAQGQLIVEKDGKTFAVNAGEVSVRGLLGYI